jgi:hypothetical protein
MKTNEITSTDGMAVELREEDQRRRLTEREAKER